MSNNDQLFELMTKMYGEMQKGFSDVNKRLDNVENRLDGVESRLDKVENEIIVTNIAIKNDIKPKIEALFDGYKQNTEAINTLSEKIEGQFTSTNKGINNLSKVSNIVNSNFADTLSEELKLIKTNVKYIKHKVQDAESDIFSIQDHLNIIK